MATRRLVSVSISVTSLDRQLSRRLEPRAAAPERRLQTIRRLTDAGIPVRLLLAPLIPVLNDSEMETMLGVRAETIEQVAYIDKVFQSGKRRQTAQQNHDDNRRD